jgi:NDP-sugar pyrophosphorylase family protein
VWVGERSQIDKTARIVAPAYIGRRAKVRAGAVITRGSNVEHHAVVDCGTVVQNATVLPYSILGAGLDLMHSVLGNKEIFSLKRKVSVPVMDTKLVNASSPSAGVRTATGLASLVSFVPLSFAKGLLKKNYQEREPAIGTACDNSFGTGIVLDKSSSVPANLMAMRDYGNQ